MEISCLSPLPKKKTYCINENHFQLLIPVYMLKFDIHFIIYTIDILDKVVKKLYIFINKICYLGSSFDT